MGCSILRLSFQIRFQSYFSFFGIGLHLFNRMARIDANRYYNTLTLNCPYDQYVVVTKSDIPKIGQEKQFVKFLIRNVVTIRIMKAKLSPSPVGNRHASHLD